MDAEIDAGYHRVTATVQVGYTVVEPSWGRGYATAALRALLEHLLADRRVRRVVAETLEEHTASRRVMEKAGMRYHDARVGRSKAGPCDWSSTRPFPPKADGRVAPVAGRVGAGAISASGRA